MRGIQRRLKFGLAEVSVEPQQAVEDGVLAEKAGFDSIWVPDHIVDVNGDKMEPWTVLSAIAVQTKKVKLGPAVTDTQRSHPSRTAHVATTLNHISKGRVLLGIGAGEAMNVVPYGLPWGEPAGEGRQARGGGQGHQAALGEQQGEDGLVQGRILLAGQGIHQPSAVQGDPAAGLRGRHERQEHSGAHREDGRGVVLLVQHPGDLREEVEDRLRGRQGRGEGPEEDRHVLPPA